MIAATRIASAQTDDPARRFRTAPPDVGRQKVIADIVLNGIDVGTHEILVDGPKVTIPHSVLQDVRLGNLASDALELQPGGDTEFGFDPKTSTLDLKVGAARLQALRIGPAGDASAPLALSPEAWGGWVNYDGNIRRGFGAGVPRRRPVDGGAFAELNLTGPDFLGYSSWSYDSARDAGQATVRLDTYGTWRPSDKTLSATVGDDVSDSPGTARPFRYAGIEVGTDHSAQPGFSQSPIASITGNAAAQSSIDVYIDNQRISRSSTSGGPFTFAVPTGSASNRIVVTDVTGRQTIVTAEAPLVDAQTISEGLLLWSAGLGVARFDYGSASNHYGEDPYAHATGRYGVTDRLTATSHVEGGGGLFEAEAGANASVASWLAVRGNVGGSASRRGKGAFGSVGLVVSGPWGLSLNASATRTTARYDDVVSVSGVARARLIGQNPTFSLPAVGNESLRLGWAATRDLQFSASYDRFVYRDTGAAGFASLGAQRTFGDVPVFANFTTNVGGRTNRAFLVGLSLSFGAVNASAAGGYGTTGPSGSFGAARPLDEGVGSVGWRAVGSTSSGTEFGTAAAETRTGLGIPGIQVDRFGRTTTTYGTARGSFGYVGGHVFAGDPIQGGLVVADAGAGDVPVTINGYAKGRTWWDGRAMLPVPVPGTPQSIGVAAEGLPLDLVPDQTERTALVRRGGAAVLKFGVRDAGGSAVVAVTDGGGAPPPGSTLVGAGSEAPVDGRGRAYLQAILPGEVLSLRRADGSSCTVATGFDGKGGAGTRIGPFACSSDAVGESANGRR